MNIPAIEDNQQNPYRRRFPPGARGRGIADARVAGACGGPAAAAGRGPRMAAS